MTRLRALCTAAVLLCASTHALADTASQNAAAESLLTMAHADKLPTQVYAQVQQAFAEKFAESKAPDSKRAVMETYLAKANAVLDQSLGWDKIKPDMIKVYTDNFSESELKDLLAFYQSPLGKKVLTQLPQIQMQSVQVVQSRVEQAAPGVNKLLADMSKELETKPAAPAKKK